LYGIILVRSKIIMLETINLIFDNAITFTGPLNGIVVFFVFIFVILIAEFIFHCIIKTHCRRK